MDYLQNVLNSLSIRFGTVLPTVVGAIVVLLVGLLVARLVQKLTLSLMGRTKLDEKIGSKYKTKFRVDKFVGKLMYYVVVVYTLIVVLNILGVTSVLQPLENMLQDFVGILPNIVAAGVIAFAGYIIAKIASEAVGFLGARLENITKKAGVETGGVNLTSILKQLVFIFVFVPILIIALDTLKMDVISRPASEMLATFLSAIPKILAAAILLGVFYVAGKYVIGILVELLRNLGIDEFFGKIGMQKITGNYRLSSILGGIALFFIMFTGIIAAMDKLELGQVNIILQNIFALSGRIFFGLVVLFGGVFISNIVVQYTKESSAHSWLTPISRFAVLGLFITLALHTMGIAEDIVNLAFGLILGSLAVAFALAFGLGGREAAGDELRKFFERMRGK